MSEQSYKIDVILNFKSDRGNNEMRKEKTRNISSLGSCL